MNANEQLQSRQVYFAIIVLMLSVSCAHISDNERRHQERGAQAENNNETKAQEGLTPDQQMALDALNQLQLGTDEKNRLYSTFPGIDHSCFPPDTSLTLTQEEFLVVMKHFVLTFCQQMDSLEREELAENAALAQEQYLVSLCLDDTKKEFGEKGLPMKGIWILPQVLNKRDVVIGW